MISGALSRPTLDGWKNASNSLAVPNKVRGPRDAEAMCSFFAHVGLPFTGFIQADEMILEVDRLGRAPLDHDGASPAVEEIARLADALCGT